MKKSLNQASNIVVVLVFAFFVLSFIMFAYALYNINVKTTGYASGYVNVTIATAVTINVTNNTVNWGSGTVNAGSDNASLITNGAAEGTATRGNWSGTNAKALVVANIGNINCSLHISGTKTAETFFGGTADQRAYQWNVSNKDANSCGAWNTTEFPTLAGAGGQAWQDVNTSAATVCDQLDFHTDKNEVFIDFKLVVPYDATLTGDRSDTITISGLGAIS